MSKNDRAQVIVLLADGFEEAGVSIILTTLRQAGLAVNLVGLRSRRVSGAHGLVIVPNTSLDRMLEVSVPILALILPGGAGHLARLRVDPRVSRLLKRSIAQKAILVGLGNQVSQTVTDLVANNGQSTKIIQPKAGMYLEDFASSLAQRLVGMTETLIGR